MASSTTTNASSEEMAPSKFKELSAEWKYQATQTLAYAKQLGVDAKKFPGKVGTELKDTWTKLGKDTELLREKIEKNYKQVKANQADGDAALQQEYDEADQFYHELVGKDGVVPQIDQAIQESGETINTDNNNNKQE
ncbi:expressed unknown protein [Seminavis robusta]|uniref:Uncharacterized protein n=1 Tax=Seminavis robusta TaxID=568900 RepID=A0A9N8ELI2_9STRA|nr:expressed unknown protein [Seminavis robusta]|eukprot:Sro1283_g259120.1 n/a (137) ;mRNA; r:15817-16227